MLLLGLLWKLEGFKNYYLYDDKFVVDFTIFIFVLVKKNQEIM